MLTRYLQLIGLLLLLLFITISPAQAGTLEDKFSVNAQGAGGLDFGQISLADLGNVVTGGEIPKTVDAKIKQPIARRWQAGDKLTTVLRLGDIPDLAPQQFSLDQIGTITGQPLASQPLTSYPLLTGQTLSHLVEAIPYLKNFSVRDIKPISELVSDAPGADTTLGALLTAQPLLGDLSLQSLKTLGSYTLTAIPNATATPLNAFRGWQTQTVDAVPGLAQVPLGRMPQPMGTKIKTTVRVLAFPPPSTANYSRTITGSKQKGFRISCPALIGGQLIGSQTECAIAELIESEPPAIPLDGATPKQKSNRQPSARQETVQWVLSVQEVEGGTGALKTLPNRVGGSPGFEPTGRHPFGFAFKQVLDVVNDARTSITSSLVFRVCAGDSCSPYNQFKVPFLSYRVNDLIVTQTEAAATNTGDNANAYKTQRSGACTGEVTAGVSVNTLAEAIANLTQTRVPPTTIGLFACSQNRQLCGRALGQYRSFSADPDVQVAIQTRPGGSDWLKGVAQGNRPQPQDLMQFYPPETQAQVIRQKLKTLLDATAPQVDPSTNQKWAGNRLIARVAQLWIGGSQSAIDSQYPDGLKQLSPMQLGLQAVQNYQALGGSPNPDCAAGTPAIQTLSNAIATATERLGAFSIKTKSAPVEGKQASAWAVNEILQSAGISQLGDNPDYIPAVVKILQTRRGAQVDPTQAQPGDIAIAYNNQHIGICLTEQCQQVRSASAITRSFDWVSDRDFDGQFNGSSVLYRITQP